MYNKSYYKIDAKINNLSEIVPIFTNYNPTNN